MKEKRSIISIYSHHVIVIIVEVWNWFYLYNQRREKYFCVVLWAVAK